MTQEPTHVLTADDALGWLRQQGITGDDPRALALLLALQQARLGDGPTAIHRYAQLHAATRTGRRSILFAAWAQDGAA